MAEEFKACSVDGCKGNAHQSKMGKKGMCQNHWRRAHLYGDPLAGGISHGEPQRFYKEVVLTYEGENCLIWPYAGTNSGAGYARMMVEGRLKVVSRMVCEDVNGPPPTPGHEAAHSCGRGDKGCVSKSHLSWKTAAENSSDRVTHGTDNRGEKNKVSKLKQSDVLEIIAMKGKESQIVTAKRYGVRQTTISMIQRRKAWAWLEV